MEEIEETDNFSILTDYDDGVVCFGTVTQSQIERFKKLPRRTVLPSDIESIRESIANSENVDEDDRNDQSMSILDKSGKNTTIPTDDSFNDVTQTTNCLDNEEATSTMKLKQSFTHDSSSNFSSPYGTKIIPSVNLIDTETINRYIRMESLSPNETYSEDQNKSAFTKDETASYIDVEEAELSTNHFVHNEASSCKSSVSSVIEQNIKNHKIPDSDDNICTLQPCSQEDEDISYCYDSEFEDTVEYSIVPDKYSITPGKQRLFDSRHAKSSIRAKTVVSSAPFMDKIEETTTPLPKALTSSISIHNVSYEPLENENNADRTSVTSLDRKSSVHYNLTSSDWDSKSINSVNMTVGELSESTKFNHSASEKDSINDVSYSKSSIKSMESSSHDSVVKQTYENNLQNQLTLTNYKTSIDFDVPLKIVNETITNTSNITTQVFNVDKSRNNMSNIEVPMADILDYNDENVSEAVLTEIKSINSSVLDAVINKTTSTRLLYSNEGNKVLDKSYNGTSHAKYSSNITELSFDVEKSMTNESNIIISTVGINGCTNEEESEAMEVDIKSTNTSVVDNVVDETMSISILSTNDKSKDLNKSSNETSEALDTSNVAEKSISIISNIIIPNAEINSYNKEKSEVMERYIRSTNTSVVDNVVDETMSVCMLSTNNESIDLNKSLNETSQAKDTLNVSEQSYNVEKSIGSIPNMMGTMADINEFNRVEEAVIKSSDDSGAANIFDETMCTSMLFTNDKSQVFNKSLNEISQAKETLNVAEQSFGVEKCMNVISNIIVPTIDTNSFNNEEESDTKDTNIKSTNTSVVDNLIDETISTSMLSTNDNSKDLNKSSNETSQAKDSLNVAEQSFGVEKCMNVISNITVPIIDINNFNNEEESDTKDTNIKSTNTSVVDNLIDETISTSMLSTNDNSKDLNKSSNESSEAFDTLNVAEQSFGVEKSTSIISNIMIPNAEINSYNKEESEAMEIDIKSTNTSVVDNLVDETISTSMLSTNDNSKDLNKSSNESSEALDTLNVTERSFGVEKSISIISNLMIPNAGINSYNEEESEAMEVDIKSTNTSVVDNVVDETMSVSMLSTNDESKDLNKSLNETSPIKDSLNATKQSFSIKKSINNMVVSPLNINDASLLSNFKDNNLKYSTDIEIPCPEKVDNIFTHEISETNENIQENPSRRMRQFLEFEHTIYNLCNDISSDTNQKKPNNYSDQSLENISMIEQTLCSESFVSTKDDDNFSSSDNSSRSKLSVIIENRTLEENCIDTTEQNEHLKSPVNDIKTTSLLMNNVNEIQDNVKLNDSTNQNQVESELNKTDIKFEIKTQSNKSTTYCDITLDENLCKTEHNISSMLSDELSKNQSCISAEIEGFFNDKSAEERFPVSKDVDEICSNHNILNNSNLQQPLIPDNMTSNPAVSAIKCTQNLANVINSSFEQNRFLNNDIQQPDLLSVNTNIYDNSLDEYNKLEEMFYLEENKKLPTFDYKTPKVQKLLDFSIMQQTPTSTMFKQKLLNFSIVDQTPNRKSTQPTSLAENAIGNKDILIDFSAVGQTLDLGVTLPDKNDFQNSSKDSLLKNLSEISAPDLELLVDESIITNSSSDNNLSLNQTITDTINLNLSTYHGKMNKSKDNFDEKNSEETNFKSSDNEYCSMLSINEQVKTDEPSSSFDKTIEQVNLELSYNTESKQNKSNKPCEKETTTEASMCSSNIHLNQSCKKSDSAEYVIDPNQPPTFNSNLYAIKDFSIIEEKTMLIPESKENTYSTFVGSDLNVSNLIQMSAVSDIDIKSNDQAVVSSDNPVIVVTPDEKSINSSSDEINSTAIHIEEHIFSHNPEFLTDIQMNDISLLECSEKSSVGESFHSIELDQLQEDNKRKSEPDQEHHSHEKKMKVATEEPSTPMSMLYKLRNMFKSSEKPPITKSNNENDLKSDNCHQKLNFSHVEQNKNKSICYKKPEVLIKSKIPCKISDKSMSTNCEFNNSSSSLNDSIKPKKGIPRFIGAPVLSDVSNSSNRKCPESRIPSKLKK